MNDPQERKLNHEELLRQAMQDAASDPGIAPDAPPIPGVAELATRFPELQIVELVGRGGMGAVFKAVQKKLERPVALKVMPTELGSDPEFAERFLREARALATLNHPGIITVHDFGERDGQCFLVTEFVDGVNLRQLMALGELSPAEALRIAPQICTALQFAHERGIVHRDIKPENILIDVDGQVKIADFGLAKVVRPGDRAPLTRSTAVFGTPHYMAPEQFRGTAAVDHRADIYSVGVVLYEMLTGQLPIGHFDPPSQRGGVPRGLDDVVRRALAQQPDKRYQHASEVQVDVERHAGEASGATGATSRTAPVGPRPTAGASSAPLTNVPPAEARLTWLPLLAILVAVLTIAAAAFARIAQMDRHRTEFRYEASLARYEAEAQATFRAEQNGTELPYPLPQLPTEPKAPWLHDSHDVPMMVGLLGGGGLLVLALGFGAVRRIRNGRGRYYGFGLAVPVAWSVPLAIATGIAFSPVVSINSHDLEQIVGIVFGTVLAAANVVFLVWQIRRQRRLLTAGVPMRAGAIAIWTVGLLGFLASGIGATAPLWLSPELTPPPRPAAMLAADLVGRSTAFVVEHLGPPVGISVSNSLMTWNYEDPAGKTVDGALVVADEHVEATVPGPVVLQSNADAPRPWIGQPLRAFVRAYGSPVERTVGSLTTVFRFDNGIEISVHDGIVVHRTR